MVYQSYVSLPAKSLRPLSTGHAEQAWRQLPGTCSCPEAAGRKGLVVADVHDIHDIIHLCRYIYNTYTYTYIYI